MLYCAASSKGFGPGGSECSGSSGCFQVHTARLVLSSQRSEPGGFRTRMLPLWDPDCRNIDSSFSPHFYVTSVTFSRKKEFQSITLSQLSPHTRRADGVDGHAAGSACFSSLPINLSKPAGLDDFTPSGWPFGFSSFQCSMKLNVTLNLL